MTITATCATIALALASAQGGETISLKGTCDRLVVERSYTRQVTIDAGGATIRGLSITGANVRWISGRIVSPRGIDGRGSEVYGLLIRRARDVRVESVTFGLSRKAVVIDNAENITISGNRFDGYGEDGIISSATAGLTIERNQFLNVVGKPTECTLSRGVLNGLSKRDCVGRGGTWKDGFHADAIQLRNGVKKAVIRFNHIAGKTQGIAQMDSRNDAPLEDILVADNEVWGEVNHITLGGTGCSACRIERNKVRRFRTDSYKAVIRPGPAQRCGNEAQDEPSDGRCR